MLFPSSINLDEGAPVRIQCSVEGTKPISREFKPNTVYTHSFFYFNHLSFKTVKWYKDNTLVEESDRVKFEADEESGSYALVIPTCLSIDDGQYHAAASNSNGEVIAAFSLVVSIDSSSSGSIDVKKILESN